MVGNDVSAQEKNQRVDDLHFLLNKIMILLENLKISVRFFWSVNFTLTKLCHIPQLSDS